MKQAFSGRYSGPLQRHFGRGEVAIVVDGSNQVLGLLTKIDLVDSLMATDRLQQSTAPV